MRPAAVLFEPAVRRAIENAVGDSRPREMAGALGGSIGVDAVVTQFVPLPLTACTASEFAVDAGAFAAAEFELRQRGVAWLGFVHSHPGGAPQPSARDRAELWRRCVQVIAAPDGAAVALAAFWFDGDGAHTLPLRCREESAR